jgi:hypothetical protein
MYTKEQRNVIYKKMLVRYRNQGLCNNIIKWDGGQYFRTEGLCICLGLVTKNYSTKISHFPELKHLSEKYGPRFYWWNLHEEGYLQRVSLLLEAVKQTS